MSKELKVEAIKVKELLLALSYILKGIIETVRSGDDGFIESVEYQANDFNKAIKEFDLLVLTENTPIQKTVLSYLSFEPKENCTSNENVLLYKQKLYNFIKRKLKECNKDYTHLESNMLYNFIDAECIYGSDYQQLAYSKEWFYISGHVIQDIIDEIVEARLKNPQKKLF